MGLEAPPAEDGGGTLAELVEWWLQQTAGAPASVSNRRQVREHLINSDLAPPRLVAVTTERIEAFLHAKEREGLAPQTVNHLRGFLSRTFGSARKVGRSYDRDTTKGGHADVIPIAAELVPYLQRAMESSPSELVFPAPDGTMMRPDMALESVCGARWAAPGS